MPGTCAVASPRPFLDSKTNRSKEDGKVADEGEIEDDKEPTILKETKLDQKFEEIPALEAKSLLGKRQRLSGDTSSIDEQWIDFLGEHDCDMEANISPASSCDLGARLESPVLKDSLLGLNVKRQRINSAATKHEFSFIPTAKTKIPCKTGSNPIQ